MHCTVILPLIVCMDLFAATVTKGFLNLELKNVASGKPAIQSSTYRDDHVLFGARLANDDSALTCSKTQWSWTLFWRTDLLDHHPILGGNLILRWEYFGTRNKFMYQVDLQVGSENVPETPTCGSTTVILDRPDDFPVEIKCNNITYGRFVTVNIVPSYAGTVTTGSPQLTLCDVKIFAATFGHGLPMPNTDNINDVAAHSHNTEMYMEDDPNTSTQMPLNLSKSEQAPPNRTTKYIQSFIKLGSTTERRKVGTQTMSRFGRLLQKMQPVTTTTTLRSIPEKENTATSSDKNEEFEGDLLYEMLVLKQELATKLHSVYSYVVFCGVAIGFLVVLCILMGVLLLWRHHTMRSSSSGSSVITHDFSFKAPSPPALPPHTPALMGPGVSPPLPPSFPQQRCLPHGLHQHIREFPKDSVPKTGNRRFL